MMKAIRRLRGGHYIYSWLQHKRKIITVQKSVLEAGWWVEEKTYMIQNNMKILK